MKNKKISELKIEKVSAFVDEQGTNLSVTIEGKEIALSANCQKLVFVSANCIYSDQDLSSFAEEMRSELFGFTPGVYYVPFLARLSQKAARELISDLPLKSVLNVQKKFVKFFNANYEI